MRVDFDKNFENAVDRAYETVSPEILSNSSPRHASYLMTKLLEFAAQKKQDVRIVSGSLFGDVFDTEQMLGALKAALSVGCRVHVLTDKAVDPGSQFAAVIKNSESASLGMTNVLQGEETLHFLLVGESAFRLETNHESSSAFGCFNNVSTGQKLKSIFNRFAT